jgi:phosphatidylethanolamine/phosphatidyl-N-methylethanolamine N-methyltransferase
MGILAENFRGGTGAKPVYCHGTSKEALPMANVLLESLTIFGKELLRNPGPVGAAVPSSPALARGMARMVPASDDGYVVELGAGTGAITTGLIRSGVRPDRLLAVEYSPAMVEVLRKRFPDITVLEGDACDLNNLLRRNFGEHRPKISAVVSGLPLRSLPCRKVARLFLEVRRLLSDGGRFIQFTYALHRPSRFPQCFRCTDWSVVWFNLPPARVESYAVTPMPVR